MMKITDATEELSVSFRVEIYSAFQRGAVPIGVKNE
jgi:hypothetical protein